MKMPPHFFRYYDTRMRDKGMTIELTVRPRWRRILAMPLLVLRFGWRGFLMAWHK
jgi:hypothetical protein